MYRVGLIILKREGGQDTINYAFINVNKLNKMKIIEPRLLDEHREQIKLIFDDIGIDLKTKGVKCFLIHQDKSKISFQQDVPK